MDDNQIKDSYKSIAAEARGLFKDNGSRFIAHAYPVETEEEVKEIVAALKKEYYDARQMKRLVQERERANLFKKLTKFDKKRERSKG